MGPIWRKQQKVHEPGAPATQLRAPNSRRALVAEPPKVRDDRIFNSLLGFHGQLRTVSATLSISGGAKRRPLHAVAQQTRRSTSAN
jgi:hypothetical protein